MALIKCHGKVEHLHSQIEGRRGKGRCLVHCFEINGLPFEFIGSPSRENQITPIAEGATASACGLKRRNGKIIVLAFRSDRASTIYSSYDPDSRGQLFLALILMCFFGSIFLYGLTNAYIDGLRGWPIAIWALFPAIFFGVGLMVMHIFLNIKRAERIVRLISA